MIPTVEYKEATLILDLLEPAKKQLVWRATIVGALQESSKDNVELGNKAIAKAFESYPPPKNTPSRRIDNCQLKARWQCTSLTKGGTS